MVAKCKKSMVEIIVISKMEVLVVPIKKEEVVVIVLM
jgi:hypothetical protein